MVASTVRNLVDENALAQRAAIEPAAFAAIYDHYFPHIFTYVRCRVDDDPTADDITAQVFERALTKIHEYRPDRAPFGAWLFGIARNFVSNHLRAERRHPWISLDFLLQRPSNTPHPEEVTVHNQTQERLIQALSELKDQEKDLLALKYVAGMTNRSIAQITGLSDSNVGVMIYRAMQQLREKLNQETRE